MLGNQLGNQLGNDLGNRLDGGGAAAPSPFLSAYAQWNIDAYTTSPRPHIPNAKSATAVSANLYSASRRMFTNPEWWSTANLVATDRAATSSDGTTSATTVVGTGFWFVRAAASASLPAGTYTIRCDVKRNTGSDQQFSFYKDSTSTRSPALPATSTWAPQSYTFTQAGAWSIGSIGIVAITGNVNANIQIDNVELYAGSLDLGPQTQAGHLYFGIASSTTAPTYASGELDPTGGQYGLIQFGVPKSLTTFTCQALVNKTATARTQCGVLCDTRSYQSFCVASESSGVPSGWFNSVGFAGVLTQFSGLWSAASKGYHVLTWRFDGTYYDFWIDDFLILRNAYTATAQTIQDQVFNLIEATTSYSGNKYAGTIALWDTAITDSQVRAAVVEQQARAALTSIVASNATRLYAAEGDSITGGNNYDYPYVYGPNASPAVYGVDYALSFSTTATMDARWASVGLMMPPALAGRKIILSVLIGANDLQILGSTAYLAGVAAYCDRARAAGFIVALCTLLPLKTSTHVGYEALRAVVNPTLRTWPGSHCDYIIDFAADPTIGTQAAGDDPAKYPDGIHPTAAVQVIMESIARPVLNAA